MNKNKPNINPKSNDPIVGDLVQTLVEAGKAILIFFFAGFYMTYKVLINKPGYISSIIPRRRKFYVIVSLSTAILIYLFCFHILNLGLTTRFIVSFPISWLLGYGITFAYLSITKGSKDKDRITTKDLIENKVDFSILERFSDDPSRVPIGVSLKDGSPVFIPIEQITEHSLTSGATGQGKTTLAKTKIHHFIKHNRPVIIIDPKGEKSDVEQIRDLCKAYGREDDFKLFSLAFPNESASYNPIKIGDPQQKKSKIMFGLNLSHEYYGAVADEFLTTILDLHKFLGKELTMRGLQKIIIKPTAFAAIETELRNLPDSPIVEELLDKAASARKLDAKDLKGLSAQLSSLNALDIGKLLNPSSDRPDLDLVEVLQKNQIAYFQMNTNGYAAIAKSVGKLIVQDLRLVSNIFQSGQVEKKFDKAICLIDEFGSFANPDFSDFLKMVRSSGIGCDLSFQGIADLRAVSSEFSEQVIGNTVVKIILRQDVNNDVETWSAMAGTKDTVVESYQTDSDPVFGSVRTGTGNIHEGKTVLIDFDVFKRLSRGQAVFIDKARHFNSPIAIWNGEVSRKKVLKITPFNQTSGAVTVRNVALRDLSPRNNDNENV